MPHPRGRSICIAHGGHLVYGLVGDGVGVEWGIGGSVEAVKSSDP